LPAKSGTAASRSQVQEWGTAVVIDAGNENAPIQLAQCRFPGLAISNVEILIYIFQIKYTEAILSNSTRKPLWLEISKTLIVAAAAVDRQARQSCLVWRCELALTVMRRRSTDGARCVIVTSRTD